MNMTVGFINNIVFKRKPLISVQCTDVGFCVLVYECWLNVEMGTNRAADASHA